MQHRKMYPVSLEVDANGDLILKQDESPQEPTVIALSPDQAPQIAGWLLEAAYRANPDTSPDGDGTVQANMWQGNPGMDPVNISIYNNDQGMVIINLGDDRYIEVSPILAKKLRAQLSAAINIAFTDLLRGDEEI